MDVWLANKPTRLPFNNGRYSSRLAAPGWIKPGTVCALEKSVVKVSKSNMVNFLIVLGLYFNKNKRIKVVLPNYFC
jgi:hypothetical protein